MYRLWIAAGALSGLLSVAMAAYAAHGAPQEGFAARTIGWSLMMQGWHALALLAVGLLAERWGGGWLLNLAGGCFVLGTVLFASAAWTLALTGRSLGMTAPTGGTILMAGWLALFVAALLPRG